jgi:hypothetical protein
MYPGISRATRIGGTKQLKKRHFQKNNPSPISRLTGITDPVARQEYHPFNLHHIMGNTNTPDLFSLSKDNDYFFIENFPLLPEIIGLNLETISME